MNEIRNNPTSATPSTDVNSSQEQSVETIDIKVIYNKKKYDVTAAANTTIADFKKQLQSLLGIIY